MSSSIPLNDCKVSIDIYTIYSILKGHVEIVKFSFTMYEDI